MDVCYCDTQAIAFILVVSVMFNVILAVIITKMSNPRNKYVERVEEIISPSVESEEVATEVLIDSTSVADPPTIVRRRFEEWPIFVITSRGRCYHREGCHYTMIDGVEWAGNKRKHACPDCLSL